MWMKYEKETPGNMFLSNAGLSGASSPEPTALSDNLTLEHGGEGLHVVTSVGSSGSLLARGTMSQG
jgi:hypothetical protein